MGSLIKKRGRLVAIIGGVFLSVIGCDLFRPTETEFTFWNNSSFDISVTPNGQSWLGFTVPSNSHRSVLVEGDSIYYLYPESDWYYVQQVDEVNFIEFWNELLCDWTFQNESSYTVTVGPQDGEDAQEWDEFDVAPGETVTIEIPYFTIKLVHNQASVTDFYYSKALGRWMIEDA